jgi:hypothetical protein
MVININALSQGHRDSGDLGACIVLVIGKHRGGELCLYEPRLILDTDHGDVVTFDSKRTSHFNCHYEGIRGSVVMYTESQAERRQKDGNGWEGNLFVR